MRRDLEEHSAPAGRGGCFRDLGYAIISVSVRFTIQNMTETYGAPLFCVPSATLRFVSTEHFATSLSSLTNRWYRK